MTHTEVTLVAMTHTEVTLGMTNWYIESVPLKDVSPDLSLDSLG